MSLENSHWFEQIKSEINPILVASTFRVGDSFYIQSPVNYINDQQQHPKNSFEIRLHLA